MTLFELLVVLVLMAISAALVWPALSTSPEGLIESEIGNAVERPDRVAGASSLLPDAAVDPVITGARRTAIKRGEPIRLRMDRDGVWAMVSVKDGSPIESGRVTMEPAWWPDVVIDALGTCVLSPNASRPNGARSWDALSCRWRGVL